MSKILIADDSQDLLEIIKITMEEQGYEICITANKRDFKSAVKSFHPDLILMDVFLNDADGRVICKDLKRNSRTKRIPVIMCSANPYALSNFHLYGANDAIDKPFTIDSLIKKIEHLLINPFLRKAS